MILSLLRVAPATGLVEAWLTPFDVTLSLLDAAAAMHEGARQQSREGSKIAASGPNALDLLDRYMLRQDDDGSASG